MKELLKHWMTARDGVSWSLTKLFGVSGVVAMSYKFWQAPNPDYIAFAGGIAAIIAALAAKYHVEEPESSNGSGQ